MSIQYFGFWPAFYHNPANTLKVFFEQLFDGIPINKPIHVHSVFSNFTAHKDPNAFLVSFSGESHNHDPKEFDLSLIMKPDNTQERVVYLPLFSIGSYEYQYWERYMWPRVMWTKTRFCAFVISNDRVPLRNKVFQMLSKYKKVDSCGQALNNCGFCAPRDNNEYFQFLRQYKFMICFENNKNGHYITEKLHNAWLGGTIPIYWGCTNSIHWLNPKAFLYLEDESDEAIQRLVDRVIELDQDPNKYLEMYNQPLLLDHKIPHDMQFDNIKAKIKTVVAQTRASPRS
jgi:hypothetical protein